MVMSERDVETLKKDVQKILSYLHNDDDTGKKGLVAEVHDIKKSFNEFVVSYKTAQAFRKGQVAVIAVIGGGVACLIQIIIKAYSE